MCAMDKMNQYEKRVEKGSVAVSLLRDCRIDARKGLPEDVFLLVSSLSPIPNVDLLIVNKDNQVLLSWRDDPYYGKGWHIPGGCIRFGETMLERVHKTALEEIGCDVIVEPIPIGIQETILQPRKHLKYLNDRGHNISILFKCRLPEGYEVNNHGRLLETPGFLQWFERFPSNFLKLHLGYGEVLKDWM